MKNSCFLILALTIFVFAQGQNNLYHKDIIGKYYFKAKGPHGVSKQILKLEKDGFYQEINYDSELGDYQVYGFWKIVGDSLLVNIKYELQNGIKDTIGIRFRNLSYKIEENVLCLTTVTEIYRKGTFKVETRYKKIGKKNSKYIAKTYTKIEDPGFRGLWRNNKQE